MENHKVTPLLVPETNVDGITIWKNKATNQLVFDCKQLFADDYKPMQLILTSLDDKKFKVGDKLKWYVLPFGEEWVTTVTQEHIDEYSTEEGCYLHCQGAKVIATQDQLPPDYINQFIEEYNNKGEVKDFEIECWDNSNYNPSMFPDIRPKLTNGFVTVVEKEQNSKSMFQPPLLIVDVNSSTSWDEWLSETETKLKELGYRGHVQNHKDEDFCYWKTFKNGEDGIYQIGILFYDFRKYRDRDPGANRIGRVYECMLLGGDRIDMCVSKNIDLVEFEKMAQTFYEAMSKYCC